MNTGMRYSFGRSKGRIELRYNDNIFTGDMYPLNMFYCFSMRKIFSNYNGPCLRIRRPIDDLETDIFFDSKGFLDMQTALNFTDDVAFVTKWYNQSQIGVDAFQDLPQNQPAIIGYGKPLIKDGAYGIYFGNTNYSGLGFDTGDTTIPLLNAVTYFRVEPGNLSFTTWSFYGLRYFFSGTRMLSFSNNQSDNDYGTNINQVIASESLVYWRNQGIAISHAPSNGQLSLCSNNIDLTEAISYNYTNNSQVQDTRSGNGTATPTAIHIGIEGTPSISRYINGFINEMIFYNEENKNDRLNIISDLQSVYNL